MEDPKQENQEEIEKLVSASQRGDADAFAKLYDIFVGPIYRYLYYRVERNDAEDLTELVFLKSWENIRQYRPRHRSFSSWIFRIAHNLTVDYYRSKPRSEELPEELPDHRAEAATPNLAHRNFDSELLSEAMSELKSRYRQVVILKYINDLSNEEIADILGRNQASLRILQFRALKSLKRILERKGFSESDL